MEALYRRRGGEGLPGGWREGMGGRGLQVEMVGSNAVCKLLPEASPTENRVEEEVKEVKVKEVVNGSGFCSFSALPAVAAVSSPPGESKS